MGAINSAKHNLAGYRDGAFSNMSTVQPNITLTSLCKALTNGEFFISTSLLFHWKVEAFVARRR